MRPSPFPLVLACAAALAGMAAWVVFFRSGLVLSHYDAKAHLVVARRVVDNLTPGWQQIGAVWLPLPHLIGMLPSQLDVFYQTGIFASFVSVVCLAVTTYASARLILRVTGSALGAVVAAALLVFNPNLLYLHTTPMTEPLLLATTSLAVLWLVEWADHGRDRVPARLAAVLFAAMWTRYEAWPVIATAIAASAYATWRRGAPLATLVSRISRLAAWPALAVGLFLVNSRITVGAWFVSEGFYVPDPSYEHQTVRTLLGVWWGTHQLSGYVMEIIALLAAGVMAWRALASRRDAPLLVTLGVFAASALPIAAFYQGHPYRIRYMIPLVAACALFDGLAVGLVSRLRRDPAPAAWLPAALAILLLTSSALESPPWSMQAPMLVEAQWDHGASVGRRAVTACLEREYGGDKILASMGSLAHYMQELSTSGLHIADFINEGNGDIWNLALQTGPAPHAGWMMIEEVAEGGDVLAEHVRHDPAFAKGMTRVCEGGGVALYRRDVTDRNARQ